MHQPKIIIPTRPRTLAEAKRLIVRAEKVGDLTEVWLDRIINLDEVKIRGIVEAAKNPLIVNLKDKTEKGTFRGNTVNKLELLGVAAEAGARFIDLSLTLDPKSVRIFRQAYRNIQLILSWHDFTNMPSLKKLQQLISKADQLGADVIKLVGTVRKLPDVYPILAVSRELAAKKRQFLTMAMGETGQVTRVLTPLLGGLGMFAALDQKSASAPGQLTVEELRKWWKDFS